jgi:hypothetical protein
MHAFNHISRKLVDKAALDSIRSPKISEENGRIAQRRDARCLCTKAIKMGRELPWITQRGLAVGREKIKVRQRELDFRSPRGATSLGAANVFQCARSLQIYSRLINADAVRANRMHE